MSELTPERAARMVAELPSKQEEWTRELIEHLATCNHTTLIPDPAYAGGYTPKQIECPICAAVLTALHKGAEHD